MDNKIIENWLWDVLGEDSFTRSMLTWDAETRRAEGWHNGGFLDRPAQIKVYSKTVVPAFLKDLWILKGAPPQDVNKPGVMLVRFSYEWGWSKAYVYPLGVLNCDRDYRQQVEDGVCL